MRFIYRVWYQNWAKNWIGVTVAMTKGEIPKSAAGSINKVNTLTNEEIG